MPQTLHNLDQEWKYWYPRVYGYFYKRLNNQYDVEELTAITLSGCFLNKDKVINFQGYVWKTAHNQLVTFIRSKSKNIIPVSLDEFVSEDTAYLNFEMDEDLEDYRSENYKQVTSKMLDCVDGSLKKDVDKEIVKKSLIEENNSTQIANDLNLTPGNVRQRLSRAISSIKKKCLDLWQNLKSKTATD